MGDLLYKPTSKDDEDEIWLEVPEAALFLEAARVCPTEDHVGGHPPSPFGYELIATFLLTGGRQKEVFGLEIGDVDFERKSITLSAARGTPVSVLSAREGAQVD